MQNDQTTTVAEVKRSIEQFADRRDWKQFHDPKNLVMAIASEVGELTEHFRWATREESFDVAADPASRHEVASELADVLMFAFEFATVCNIDVVTAIANKLEFNEARYPVEKSKGISAKYDQLDG